MAYSFYKENTKTTLIYSETRKGPDIYQIHVLPRAMWTYTAYQRTTVYDIRIITPLCRIHDFYTNQYNWKTTSRPWLFRVKRSRCQTHSVPSVPVSHTHFGHRANCLVAGLHQTECRAHHCFNTHRKWVHMDAHHNDNM